MRDAGYLGVTIFWNVEIFVKLRISCYINLGAFIALRPILISILIRFKSISEIYNVNKDER